MAHQAVVFRWQCREAGDALAAELEASEKRGVAMSAEIEVLLAERDWARDRLAAVEALCVRFETEAIGDGEFVEMLRAAIATAEPPSDLRKPDEP